MSNPIKYSTGSESLALKKGNFYIGTGDVGKGPSNTTGYYQGPDVPSGGYVIYLYNSGQPGDLSYHSAPTDAELISFTNNLAGQSYTTVNECFTYYASQTDKVCFNRNYEGIVTDGLILNVDAGFTPSYPKNGTTWYDIVGTYNGTLINGPTYSSGSISFDYSDDYISFPSLPVSTEYTVSCWFTTNTGNWNGALFGFGTGTSPNTQDVYLFGEWSSGCNSPSGGSFGFNTWNCDSWAFGNASSILKGTGYHHVVATFNDGDVASNTLWLDGVEKSLSQQIGTTQFSANLKNQFKIASNGWHTGNQLWNGSVSNCLVYDRHLTPSEISQNFNAQKGRFGL